MLDTLKHTSSNSAGISPHLNAERFFRLTFFLDPVSIPPTERTCLDYVDSAGVSRENDPVDLDTNVSPLDEENWWANWLENRRNIKCATGDYSHVQ